MGDVSEDVTTSLHAPREHGQQYILALTSGGVRLREPGGQHTHEEDEGV